MSSSPSIDANEKPGASIEVEARPDEYPSNRKGIVIMSALFLAAFLVTLDQNIISTAIPRITDEFDSLNDVGWYGSAYLLTMCSFQLLMGKVYKFYPAKPLFIAGCVLFEVGSVVCGAAPSSNAFIVGRAIAGLGASGLFSGLMVIMFHVIPLQQRPIYQGCFGAVFAVASVIGPLVGGSFTDKVTWRWCFYINLPVGAISLVVTSFILHLPNQKLDPKAEGWWARVQQLDPIGNLVFFPGIVCLILALYVSSVTQCTYDQWGGTVYPWSNGRIIALLVLFGVLVAAFIGVQAWKKENATIPPRIIKQRSIIGAVWFGFFNGAGMMVIMYYLPIWFQAVKGVSAIDSGIMLLPTILSTVIGSLSSGIVISKLGYYTPFFYASSIIMPIGCGLLATLTPDTESSKWIGYQILFGVGLGFGAMQPLNVAQTILDRSDIATGSALIMFTRFLGAAVFLPVAQSLFVSGLISKLTGLSGINSSAITDGGATELRKLVPPSELPALLSGYNGALIDVFYLVIATSSITIFGTVLIEWRSLKAVAKQQAGNTNKPSEEVKADDAV